MAAKTKGHSPKEIESLASNFCGKLPKRLYLEWSKRAAKTVNDHARIWGLECGSREVDLKQIVCQLHVILADLGKKQIGPGGRATHETKQASDDDKELAKLRRVNVELKEIELRKKVGELVPLAPMQEFLTEVASLIRAFGELAERDHSVPAHELFAELHEEFSETIKGFIANGDVSTTKKTAG